MIEGAPVDWLPAVLFLVVGLIVGAVLVRRAHGAKHSVIPAEPLDFRDLVGRREVLVRQLRELEDTSAKRNPGQLASERYALELSLARTLRDLDAHVPKMPATKPVAAPEPVASNAAVRGFLWGIGSATAIGLLLYFVNQAAKPRETGGPVTGNVPMAQPAAAPDAQTEERDLKAAVSRSPEDIEARLRLTRFYLGHQDMMGVWRETQEILAKSPDNPRALSYQALVRLSMGQGEVALDMLKKALRADPDNIETYIHMSLVNARLGHPKDADASIDAAVKRFPDQAPMLREVRQEIEQAVQKAAAKSGPSNSAEATEATDAAAPPPAESRGEPRISGTLDLDPSLTGKIAPGTVIFVTVRESGFGAGPPIAAKRLAAGAFPIPFEISSSDSMRGDPIPAAVLLEARADADGDPLTRSPDDPVARVDDLKTPATGVRLVLKRRP